MPEFARAKFRAAAVRHPDGYDEASVLKLNAVPGSRGDDAPGILFAEGCEYICDFSGVGPRGAVVFALHVKYAGVVVTIEGVYCAVFAVGDHDEVADGTFAICVATGDNGGRVPGLTIVCAAPHKHVIAVPIAASAASRLRRGEEDVVLRTEDARYAVDVIPVCPTFKEVDFVYHVTLRLCWGFLSGYNYTTKR